MTMADDDDGRPNVDGHERAHSTHTHSRSRAPRNCNDAEMMFLASILRARTLPIFAYTFFVLSFAVVLFSIRRSYVRTTLISSRALFLRSLLLLLASAPASATQFCHFSLVIFFHFVLPFSRPNFRRLTIDVSCVCCAAAVLCS